MRNLRPSPVLMTAIGTVALAASPAAAQFKPWILYVDPESTSRCDVVNAANVELVVLNTGQLTIVTGQDVTLQDTFVDNDGFVYFEGSPSGTIGFSTDADGFRTLWWTTLTGRAVGVDAFTGVPYVSDALPGEFSSVPCDACDFWDDQSVCVEPPTIVFNFCGMGTQASLAMTAVGLTMMGFVRRRRW